MDDELIRRLVDAHLVRGEFRGGAQWYELAHDRLIAPVRASNRAWFDEKLHKVQKTAVLWEAQGRSEGLLLLGADLVEAQTWARAQPVLTQIERRFLIESEKAQAAKDREGRQARRLLWAAIAASAGLLLAIVFYVQANGEAARARRSELASAREAQKANWQAWIADGARFHAGRSAAEAELERAEAETQRIAADAQRREADTQRIGSESRRLATLSTQYRASRLDLAVLLALEAWRTAPSAEALDSLALALESSGLVETVPVGDTVTGVAYSPDGAWLAVGTRSGTLRLLPLNGGTEPRISPAGQMVWQIAFDQRGELLAWAGREGRIFLRDMKTGREAAPPIETGRQDLRFALSPDGKWLALMRGALTFREIATGAETKAAGSPNVLGAFTFSIGPSRQGTARPRAQKRLLFAGVAGNAPADLLLWDSATGERLPVTFDRTRLKDLATPYEVNAVACSPDGERCVSGGRNGQIVFWHVVDAYGFPLNLSVESGVGKDDGPISFQTFYPEETWGLTYRPDGARLASSGIPRLGEPSRVLIWGPPGRTWMYRNLNTPAGVMALTFSADGKRVAGASPFPWASKGIAIWDAERTPDPEPGARVAANAKQRQTLAFPSKGVRIADSGSEAPYDLALSPDGGLLASASSRIVIRNAATGTVLRSWTPTAKPIVVAASPRAERFATVFEGGVLALDDGSKSFRADLGVPSAIDAAFSLDGNRLAVGIQGRRVIVFDVGKGLQKVNTLNYSPVDAVAPSPDGRLVATGGNYSSSRMLATRNALALWNAETGALLKSIEVDGPLVKGLAFSADGKRLASLHADGSVRIWDDVSVEAWQERACRVVQRNLCPGEWRQWIGSGAPRATCPNLAWPAPASECEAN